MSDLITSWLYHVLLCMCIFLFRSGLVWGVTSVNSSRPLPVGFSSGQSKLLPRKWSTASGMVWQTRQPRPDDDGPDDEGMEDGHGLWMS